jgi:hypothetical protein
MFQGEFRAGIFGINTSEIIPKTNAKFLIIETKFLLRFFPEFDRSTAPAWNSVRFVVFINL